jgi:Domain of unknown function (DU1801)
MSDIQDWIYQYDGNQRDVLLYFHDLFTNEFNLQAKIRYKIPFYYGRTWICYLNPLRSGKVDLVFIRGHELSNDQNILDHKDRKQVRGVEFENLGEVKNSLIMDVIQEAILLDETKIYGSKRKSKK